MEFLEVSAKDDSNIEKIFSQLTAKVMQSLGQTIQVERNAIPLEKQ
jgi:hypothetical protein